MWGNFLVHEKLVPDRMHDADLLRLMELLSELQKRYPNPLPYRSYADRLECRKQVCIVAMDLGIDLPAIRHKIRGKVLMGRGLLDAWNEVYATRYGSNRGTPGQFEVIRRKVVTKLSQENNDETSTGG